MLSLKRTTFPLTSGKIRRWCRVDRTRRRTAAMVLRDDCDPRGPVTWLEMANSRLIKNMFNRPGLCHSSANEIGEQSEQRVDLSFSRIKYRKSKESQEWTSVSRGYLTITQGLLTFVDVFLASTHNDAWICLKCTFIGCENWVFKVF